MVVVSYQDTVTEIRRVSSDTVAPVASARAQRAPRRTRAHAVPGHQRKIGFLDYRMPARPI